MLKKKRAKEKNNPLLAVNRNTPYPQVQTVKQQEMYTKHRKVKSMLFGKQGPEQMSFKGQQLKENQLHTQKKKKKRSPSFSINKLRKKQAYFRDKYLKAIQEEKQQVNPFLNDGDIIAPYQGAQEYKIQEAGKVFDKQVIYPIKIQNQDTNI